MEALPKPGSISTFDFRGTCSSVKTAQKPIKLLQWNIERGYKLPGSIEELKKIDADVLALQEVDIGCERSGGLDTGIEIAKALGLNYAFFCEFEELHSTSRDAKSQGGGVHGNAILTKYDFEELGLVEHKMHPVDWNNPEHPLAKREPRQGRRAVLRGRIKTPQGPLVVYCAHFEVFCGMLARMCHLADIFEDARCQVQQGFCHQAILGDLNTMAHGIARLSPNFCNDHMRFRSLGMDEAVVWEKYLLSCMDADYAPTKDDRWANQGGPQQDPAGTPPEPGMGTDSVQGRKARVAEDAAAEAAMLAAELAQDAAADGGARSGGGAQHGERESRGAAERGKGEGSATCSPASLGKSAGEPLVAGTAALEGSASPQMVAARAGVMPGGGSDGPAVNQRLLQWGLSRETAAQALNPGFEDPFPASTTVTLDNPTYRWFGVSLMRGKLDWVLLRRLDVLSTSLGNHGYEHSDHKWLGAEVSWQ